jgi:formamidopyrimidine-DNA glycosylase
VRVRIPPRVSDQIMPELPEVEIQVRQLRRRLCGAKIRSVRVCDAKLRLPRSLAGRSVQRVWRRGKFIIIDLDDGRHLVAHLRMTGWFEFRKPPKYRAAIDTTRASVYFEDSRRFGTITVVTDLGLEGILSSLGTEPFKSGALERVCQTSRAIKVALLDQRLVAGIGNIYANESLWRAGIDPRRRSNRLNAIERCRLQRAVVAALRKGIAYGPRIFEIQQFAVYDREGKTCRRCGTKIRRILQAQRSTFFCAGCQD